MPQRRRVAITMLVMSTLSGLASTDAFGSPVSQHHLRASSIDRMLPFNANFLAEPSKRLLKRKHGREPTSVERRGRAQLGTASPLSSPTDGSPDSPACIPAELC